MDLSTSWGTGRPSTPSPAPSSTSWGTGRTGRSGRRLAGALLSVFVASGVLTAVPSAAHAAASSRAADSAVRTDAWSPTDSGRGWSARGATGSQLLPLQGAGVTVAVLDSGVDEVPALAGRVVQGADFTGEGFADGYGHGTFVAGLIAGDGQDADGDRTRIVGAAPAASIVSVKVVRNDGTSDEQTLVRGLVWLIQNHAAYGIGVANISLGLAQEDTDPAHDPVDALVEALWHAGVTVVVSAGNDAGAVVRAPADDPTVLTVGAVYAGGDPSGGWSRLAPFSDSGSDIDGVTKPEVTAPGVHVRSTLPADSRLAAEQTTTGLPAGYGQLSGTSMAAGVESGLAADVLALRPQLTPAQVKAVLVRGAVGPNRTESVVRAAMSSPWGATDPAPSPGLVSLTAALSSAAGIAPMDDVDGWASATFTDAVWSSVVWSDAVWSTVVWSSVVWSSVVWSNRSDDS